MTAAASGPVRPMRAVAVIIVTAAMLIVASAGSRGAESWRDLVEAAGYAYSAGRPYQAQELLEEAVGLTEPGTEPRAAVLNNLAIVLEANGYLHAAEQLYGRVIGLWTELHGPGHVNVSRTLGNLGDFHYRRKQMDDALEAYELAITTAEQARQPDAADVRRSLYVSYARILQDLGRDADAEAARRKAGPPAGR